MNSKTTGSKKNNADKATDNVRRRMEKAAAELAAKANIAETVALVETVAPPVTPPVTETPVTPIAPTTAISAVDLQKIVADEAARNAKKPAAKPVAKLSLSELMNIVGSNSAGVAMQSAKPSKRGCLAENLVQLPKDTVVGTGTIKAVLEASGYPSNHNPERLKLAEGLVTAGVLRFNGKNSMGHNTWRVVKSVFVAPATAEEKKEE
jgi:hypothetical protein